MRMIGIGKEDPMGPIYVVGHKNPDADSICAAIACAEMLNELGYFAVAARAGELNAETTFALSTFGFEPPQPLVPSPDMAVYLVDHNEPVQMPDGVAQDQVVGVVDHHKLGGLKTSAPIYFRVEPLGSTCTVLARMFDEMKIDPSRQIAGVLLSGLISDTLLFRSPTCTPLDEQIAHRLAEHAGVELEHYGMEMLKKKSDIEGRSASELLNRDLKEFSFAGHRVAIGQVELMDFSQIEPNMDALLEEMRAMLGEGYELVVLMITHILSKKSRLYAVGTQNALSVFERAFEGRLESGYIERPVVSRKKEVVPPLERAFEED
ncbi:manganese-dependent inorganic pyrophosphatase [Methermicoccus shengliensis]|uniref:inorganic diphosphatase n=1 Tax=Methermicoccus shengliensis TaxID=660064 RepID=A0A832RXH2_9EURY|nr:manganese-dependent inorganic pyrophosphatase [Methermicoccus shengliensis]KUK04506.1 MAG: Manganese-dependent inorganic pyrophosphatase [Euryarchaeota archaeon 55_53]KUK30590.1 MAG: Manganese-dependent inorganic pyrophosphatase [Methanosarcinales archeaon 56_1174]MDI3488554.1 manganese-dependent inorganic pyrophosphatase [Methanosarcinales archaeon]MDN5295413.1 manganese-dependent inorganic pyrophosphatase [Methanosarcinales archaeon]HIH70181.1 manganese-dependent inorganic pyrophosphatase